MMLNYIGGGAFLPDVPARDLNESEVKSAGGEAALIASGLYAKSAASMSGNPKAAQPQEDED